MNKIDRVEKYNDFLKENGFSLDRKNEYCVMNRSTSPITLNAMASVKLDKVSNILEIGRNNGYSFGFFKFCFPDAMVVSVDIHRTKTSDKISKLFENFTFIDGTSYEIKKHNIIFDIVFIDGCHTFEWCKNDWENIQSNISENSVIFFDDLDYGDGGVQRFFDTINKQKFIKYVDGDPIYGVVYGCKSVGENVIL